MKKGPFEEAAAEAEAAEARVPGEKSWGLFARQANPEPGFAARGRFLWFESHEDLQAFLSRHCVYWAGFEAGEADDMPRICEAVARLARKASGGECRLADALEEISDWLYEFNFEISWAGPAQDLMTGEGEFPGRVRTWYRRIVSDETIRPVREEDANSLREHECLEFLNLLGEFADEEP